MSAPLNQNDLVIFAAALSGISANPAFFGPLYQQSPRGAVEFAMECVREARAAIAETDPLIVSENG
jgi:hypothetical protein